MHRAFIHVHIRANNGDKRRNMMAHTWHLGVNGCHSSLFSPSVLAWPSWTMAWPRCTAVALRLPYHWRLLLPCPHQGPASCATLHGALTDAMRRHHPQQTSLSWGVQSRICWCSLQLPPSQFGTHVGRTRGHSIERRSVSPSTFPLG